MSAVPAALLGAASAAAAGDWWSRLRRDRRLEYVCKPLTLALLVGVAATVDPDSTAMRAWFVAALVCSLAGDVLLMLPSDRFVAGLGAFLAGHVAYVGGFWASGWVRAPRLVLGVVVVALVITPVAWRIVRGAHRQGLGVPVAMYIAVISAMVVSAVGSGRPFAIAGASLFAASDSLIGWARFVGPPFRAGPRFAPVAIMVTYHAGQALLVAALVA
jgi:uncharacterized membrane protein YhhN